MHALSVRQPYAEEIATGRKVKEFRTWSPRALIGRDLLIVSSKTAESGGEELPRGVAVCVVHVTKIVLDGDVWAWHLRNPRRVTPFELRGSAAIFHVPDERVIVDPTAPSPMPLGRVTHRRRLTRAAKLPYTFQRADRTIRGEARATMAEASQRALELANDCGDYVYIMRDGLHIGGEWPNSAGKLGGTR